MSKIEIPRQIRTEDYAEDERALIGKLSSNLTPFMDSVYRVLNGGVDYDNLNRELVNIDVIIDPAGVVQNAPQIKTKVKGRVKGTIVVNAVNLINPAVYPDSVPGIFITTNGNLVTILKVVGLPVNSQWTLTVELIG